MWNGKQAISKGFARKAVAKSALNVQLAPPATSSIFFPQKSYGDIRAM